MPTTLPPERGWPAWRLAVALVSLAMGLALLLPTSVLAQKPETIPLLDARGEPLPF